MCPEVAGGGPDPSNDEFAAYLSKLKERGSALLVVGELPRACYDSFCRDVLGDPAAGPRCRILVNTDDRSGSPTQSAHGLAATDVPTRRIVATVSERGGAAAAAVGTADEPITYVDGDNLSKLGIEISEQIRALEAERGELNSAELRLCFDSLRPLIAAHGEEPVFRFLHVLIGRIQATAGMGHFHLQVEAGDELVATFADLFDAVIELAPHDDRLVQRWSVPERELTSGWISV